MRKEEMTARLQAGMARATVSPQLRRRTLLAIQGKEQPIVKKKLSAILVFVLIVVLGCTAAIAAARRAGMLDFIGRYQDTYIPEDAQSYVQQDVLSIEHELATVQIRELYYDGRTARMTVDIIPRDEKTLLSGVDMALDDRWQNMTRNLDGEWDATDERTLVDAYHQGEYTALYNTNVWLSQEEEGEIAGGSLDYNLSEDGTLTYFKQVEYPTDQPSRGVEFHVSLMPYTQPITAESVAEIEKRVVLSRELTLNAADMPAQTYESTETLEFASVGVRVDKLRIEVKAQEIYAEIDFTVIDREKYDALDDGLWFEFIDPESTAETPYGQRLKGGLTGGGSLGPVDSDDLETAVRFRQTETLGRNELYETYTLRAYECWEKERFETHTFQMKAVGE